MRRQAVRRFARQPVQECFELGEDLLDGTEIGTIRREEEEFSASRADRAPNGLSFMVPRLSMMTMSPASRAGMSVCST